MNGVALGLSIAPATTDVAIIFYRVRSELSAFPFILSFLLDSLQRSMRRKEIVRFECRDLS